MSAKPFADRLWSRVNKDGPLWHGVPCWIWTGARHTTGYGVIFKADSLTRNAFVHRVTYELLIGPIGTGLEIDHLCRNRLCCNPAHLEAVTHRVNFLRGISPLADHARKTHCPQGHAYTSENTRVRRGRRFCRTCLRERNRRLANQPHPPLTWELVHTIRARFAVGDISRRKLAVEFHLDPAKVSRIISGQCWKVGDQVVEQRRLRGTEHPHATINEDTVRAIREARSCGHMPAEIGQLLGVRISTVQNVLQGKAWTWVT